jgi:hypothetical protein
MSTVGTRSGKRPCSTKPCPNQSVSALPSVERITSMAFDDSTKMPPTGHHSRRDMFKSAPDEPQQRSAQPEFARHSTIERAVRRLGWTPQMPYKTPRGLDDIVNEQRVRFGRRVGSTRLSLVSRLCLASVLVAVPAAAGIFWFRHLTAEKAFTELPQRPASVHGRPQLRRRGPRQPAWCRAPRPRGRRQQPPRHTLRRSRKQIWLLGRLPL